MKSSALVGLRAKRERVMKKTVGVRADKRLVAATV